MAASPQIKKGAADAAEGKVLKIDGPSAQGFLSLTGLTAGGFLSLTALRAEVCGLPFGQCL